jgi:N-acetylmuramoyl-L-alanine amidase
MKITNSILFIAGVLIFAGCAPSTDNIGIESSAIIPDQHSGSLNSLDIAISPGHGLMPNTSNPGTWMYQRTITNGILEDTFTQDFCIDYLYPLLERCGATVIALRQRDRTIMGVSEELGWKESSLMYLEAINSQAASQGLGDVTVRPAYAVEKDADYFVSVHINSSGSAGGTTARGIESYLYSQQLYADYSLASSVTNWDLVPPGSYALAQAMHQSTVLSAKTIDSSWGDRNIRVANFGELRGLSTAYTSGGKAIPGVMINLGFMDNIQDAAGLLNPQMSAAMARGIVKGLIYASGNSGIGYPPVSPLNVQAVKVGNAVRVSWTAGVDPTDSVSSTEGSFVIKAATISGTWVNVGLVSAGTTQFDITATGHGALQIKVAARNAAGESLDSEIFSITF